MQWSKAQEDAIKIRDKNILVSAAAGSGKTAVLVERIKQLILSDNVEINQILVVTFSNAAAAELKERIIAAIYDEIESNQGRDEFLTSQLNKIGKANISTFHAFSLEIIRRYFYLINLEPNFRICDDANRTILQNESMEELFQMLFREENSGFLSFLNKYAGSKNENDVKSMIQATHQFIQSMPYPFQWLEENVQNFAGGVGEFINGPLYNEVWKNTTNNLKKALRCFKRALDLACENGIESLYIKLSVEYGNIENTYYQICNNSSIEFDEMAMLIKSINFERASVKKEEKEAYEEVKFEITQLREKGKKTIKEGILGKYYQRTIAEHLGIINREYDSAITLSYLVREFDNIYKEKKTEKGLIDFSDIEHMALLILEDETVSKEYRDKFLHIFIDEYQDSNMVQETLIDKIKRDNNVFMVGDVKQSIYKFRLAEPEIFLAKYKKYKEEKNENNIKIDLNLNFRSKSRIIEGINHIFQRIMNEESAEIDYDCDAALYKGSAYDGELDFPIKLVAVNTNGFDGDEELDQEIKEMKSAEIEANAAVKVINELAGLPVYDEKLGKIRNLDYKDIVILMRSAAGYKDVYSEVLNSSGIPNFLDMEDGYFDTLEVGVFLNLLRIIDNRMQDIPLISVLRSPIFDFSIKELINIRVGNKGINYHKAFSTYASRNFEIVGNEEENQLISKCKRAIGLLDKWKFDSTYLTIEDLITMLIKETDYYDYIAALPNGFQRQSNINALIDKAILFQNMHLKGLFGFINYIDQLKRDKVVTGQVKLLSENDNVVRIMTVHKSKGLEFPAVIVSALGKKFNRDSISGKINFHKDLGIGLRFVDEEQSYYLKTVNQLLIEERKDKEAMAEEMRILYVALTRAKDRLILMGSVKGYEESVEKVKNIEPENAIDLGSFMEWLLVATDAGDIERENFHIGQIQADRKYQIERNEDIKEVFNYGFKIHISEENENHKGQIEKRLNYEYPNKGLTQLQSKFSVSEIKRLRNKISGSNKGAEVGLKEKSIITVESLGEYSKPKFISGETELSSTDKGTIFHRAMEKIDYKIGNDSGKVKEFIESLVKTGFFSKEEADTIDVGKIVGFFTSNLGMRAAQSDGLYRETSFILRKPASELELPAHLDANANVIIQGSVDCYFKDGEKYVLVDFKTDFIKDKSDLGLESFVDEYIVQLKLYKEALEKIRNINISETYLYLFSLGRAIYVDI